MAIQLSTAVRNARLDSIESTTGTAAVLRILTGSPPADCATAETGTILAEMTLPSDWMAAASGGSVSKTGTWQDASANNPGTAGYFRIYNSGITTCHLQGTITATSGGGDMELDNTSITAGQTVTITTFTLTDANA
jgi:hypothetical protein